MIVSIPRPEVVRRVRAEARDSPRQSPAPVKMDVATDGRNVSTPPRSLENLSVPTGPGNRRSPILHPDAPRPNLPAPPHQQPGYGAESLRPSRSSEANNSNMPPPSVPSQTLSAQELRESARMTLPRVEKSDSQQGHIGSAAPSPRQRSLSPTSRPGTRDPSNDSRGSGGRTRADEPKRPERESRQDGREHGSSIARRDSLTHNRSERSGRERGRDRDGDRDDRDRERDRGRDRHGHGEREREKGGDRDRDRDRERDRDRDRHRRDEKDRDRDRKESRGQTGNTTTPVIDERNLPTRPDPRHRNGNTPSEDTLGKRRRPLEDDVGDFFLAVIEVINFDASA